MNISTLSIHLLSFSPRTKEWFAFAISLICLALFIIAAYDKIADHERFVKGLAAVPVIGIYAGTVAWLVPMIEVIVTVLLLIPSTQKFGLWAFLITMVGFTIYILGMWLWAENLPCHCNLIVEKLSWGEHVVFNMVFIGLAAWALRLVKNKEYKS
ncbi:hypothetical protein D3C87_50210 [compost metagenome]